MSRLVETKRIVALLVVLMAAVVMLSGPVAQMLDLPEPVAEAKKKKKKKKKRSPAPAFNVVQCSGAGFFCEGTDLNDFLVGTDAGETIAGREGNDVYQANGGVDFLADGSPTSSDAYTGYSDDFGTDDVVDKGGSSDFLDLGSFRLGEDFSFVRDDEPDPNPDDLTLDGPGSNDIFINDHFGQGRIEFIRFANGTITGTQAESLAREATPEEQAQIEERLDEERTSPSGEATNQQEQASS